MIVISLKKTLGRRVQITVQRDSTPGSWGSHQLLLKTYRELESLESDWMKKIKFSEDFLDEMLAKHGELHCEYCGKQHLVIYHWPAKFIESDAATADHFYPKSRYPNLEWEKSNLIVSCSPCNTKKDDKVWPKEAIKFPYL